MTRSSEMLGLDLDATERLVVRFHDMWESDLPESIRSHELRSEAVRDQRHAAKAVALGQANVAEVGRERPGRVDTGLRVYNNIRRVQVASIRSLLALEGLVLVDAHFSSKGSGRGVLNLNLSRSGKRVELDRATIEWLRSIARGSVFQTDVWDNSNLGNPATVNLKGRSTKNGPEATLVLRDGFLRIVGVEDGTDVNERERREDARIRADLRARLEGLK